MMHFQSSKINNKDKQKSRKRKLIEEDATELKIKKSLLGNTIGKLHEEANKYA